MADPAQSSETFAKSLADFQAAHPDAEVEQLNYPGGRMIVRTPDEGTYAQFITDSSDPGKRSAAIKSFIRRCVLSPTLDVVDDLFRRKPGLPFRIADKLSEKAGAGDEITLGK